MVLQDVLPLADLAAHQALPELPGVPLDGLDEGFHFWGQVGEQGGQYSLDYVSFTCMFIRLILVFHSYEFA